MAGGAARVYAASRQAIGHDDPRVVPVRLDLADRASVEQAAAEIGSLDILINSAGLALYDDLSDQAAIQQQFDVNVFGPLALTLALAPQLAAAGGSVVFNLSINALAPLPLIAGYSMSKAAGLSMVQSLRTLLGARGIGVHASLTGPVDTGMSAGVDIPKASPDSVAAAIFGGLERGEDEIFPGQMAAQFADGWRNGGAKILEGQYAEFAKSVMNAHA